MFGIFKSEAPRYRGSGQPNGYGQGGVLGAVGRVVGGTKPAYRGAAQPAGASGLFGWFSGSPAYRTASPVAEPVMKVSPADSIPGPAPATAPEPELEDAEVELDAHCEPGGNGEGSIELEHGEPLLARVPVTIVIRRSPE
jgi:hypothetical protein